MKKYFLVSFLICLLLILFSSFSACAPLEESFQNDPAKETNSSFVEEASPEKNSLVEGSGKNLQERILVPKGYERENFAADSLGFFLRNLPLKPDGSPVLLFNGKNKGNQSAHMAVFEFDVGDEDLQQCADTVMRVYSEYFWATGQPQRIQFHLTNGFLMDYPSYREGNRLQIEVNQTFWSKTAAYDASYETFRKYFRIVMSYAGTLSLDKESSPVSLSDLQPGDLFLRGGSPGHCVMVVDTARNLQGETAFLLAQSYMPAQDFHLLKNPAHDEDPWYYSSELSYPFQTPEYTFAEGSLKRWNGFSLP